MPGIISLDPENVACLLPTPDHVVVLLLAFFHLLLDGLWTSHEEGLHHKVMQSAGMEGLPCPVHKRLDIEACCASLWHSLPLPHVLFVGLRLLDGGDPEL